MHLTQKLSVLYTGMLCLSASTLIATNWTTPEQISDSASSINPTPTSVTLDQNSNGVTGWLQGEIGMGDTLYSASHSLQAPLLGTIPFSYTQPCRRNCQPFLCFTQRTQAM